MSKNKMGKELNEAKLQKISGGNITILDHGNGRKQYIASEKYYDPNCFGIGSGDSESFRTLEEAKDCAKKRGWSTFTYTYKRGRPKQLGCCVDPCEKREERWIETFGIL